MRRVLLIVLSLIPVLALGQPVYDCHRAEGKIKIDGKIGYVREDLVCWDAICTF